MFDSQLNGRERRWQLRLSKLLLLMPFLLTLESSVEEHRPDREPRPAVLALIIATEVPLARPGQGEVRVGRLWQLTSAEPRFGGLSALALSGGNLLAITDSGRVVRWPKDGGLALVQELPDGPGPPQWKIHRDSEALVRDPAGRGWWIAFEQFHSLMLFDRQFTRSLATRPVQLRTWWRNWGVEALTLGEGDGLLLLPESGDSVVELGATGDRRHSLDAEGQIADAVRLSDGRIVVAVRKVRPWGIVNSLAWLKRDRTGFQLQPWGTLPLGRWDNVEGLAAEPLPDGGSRLWFVTDDDFKRRTLLGWLDTTKAPADAEA